MDSKTDLTNFWIGWKATCAIRDCTDKAKLVEKCNEKIAQKESIGDFKEVVDDSDNVVRLANEVIKSTNVEFINKLNYFSQGGKRSSVYGGEVDAWKANCGSAFEILEGEFYEKQTIKGQPFKSYLFENIGKRKGCLSGNLFGYIKLTIRSIVRNSFSKELEIEERENDEGDKVEVDVGSTYDRSDVHSRSAELNLEIKQVGEFFARYIEELGEEWDRDHWISLYAGFNRLPVNNPEVAALCKRSKSALAELSRKTMGNLLQALRGRFSDRAIGGALEGVLQDALDKKIGGMDFFSPLEQVWKKRNGSAGK